MSAQDEDLRDRVNDAIVDNDEPADNDRDDIAEDDSHDDSSDDAADDDSQDDDSSEDDSDDADDKSDRRSKGSKSDRSAPVDDNDSAEDDDDPAIDYARPQFVQKTAEVKPFDISTLPKDPETGLVDPVEANRLINEHYTQQQAASSEAKAAEAKNRDLLIQQWTRVSKKYPAVYSKPRLRDLARDIHMASIGTDNYLTPAQAAAKIDRIRREEAKSGYRSAKTRRTVERSTSTERNSGKGADSAQKSDYEKAKSAAQSRDPQKAKAGRIEVMRLRRLARERSGR